MKFFKKLINRTYFLVVYIKSKDLKVPIFIPFPLAIAEDLVESIVQIYKIARWVKPGIKKKFTIRSKWVLDTDRDMVLLVDLIKEFRKTGRFTLVEVRDGDTHVSIKTY